MKNVKLFSVLLGALCLVNSVSAVVPKFTDLPEDARFTNKPARSGDKDGTTLFWQEGEDWYTGKKSSASRDGITNKKKLTIDEKAMELRRQYATLLGNSKLREKKYSDQLVRKFLEKQGKSTTIHGHQETSAVELALKAKTAATKKLAKLKAAKKADGSARYTEEQIKEAQELMQQELDFDLAKQLIDLEAAMAEDEEFVAEMQRSKEAALEEAARVAAKLATEAEEPEEAEPTPRFKKADTFDLAPELLGKRDGYGFRVFAEKPDAETLKKMYPKLTRAQLEARDPFKPDTYDGYHVWKNGEWIYGSREEHATGELARKAAYDASLTARETRYPRDSAETSRSRIIAKDPFKPKGAQLVMVDTVKVGKDRFCVVADTEDDSLSLVPFEEETSHQQADLLAHRGTVPATAAEVKPYLGQRMPTRFAGGNITELDHMPTEAELEALEEGTYRVKGQHGGFKHSGKPTEVGFSSSDITEDVMRDLSNQDISLIKTTDGKCLTILQRYHRRSDTFTYFSIPTKQFERHPTQAETPSPEHAVELPSVDAIPTEQKELEELAGLYRNRPLKTKGGKFFVIVAKGEGEEAAELETKEIDYAAWLKERREEAAAKRAKEDAARAEKDKDPKLTGAIFTNAPFAFTSADLGKGKQLAPRLVTKDATVKVFEEVPEDLTSFTVGETFVAYDNHVFKVVEREVKEYNTATGSFNPVKRKVASPLYSISSYGKEEDALAARVRIFNAEDEDEDDEFAVPKPPRQQNNPLIFVDGKLKEVEREVLDTSATMYPQGQRVTVDGKEHIVVRLFAATKAGKHQLATWPSKDEINSMARGETFFFAGDVFDVVEETTEVDDKATADTEPKTPVKKAVRRELATFAIAPSAAELAQARVAEGDFISAEGKIFIVTQSDKDAVLVPAEDFKHPAAGNDSRGVKKAFDEMGADLNPTATDLPADVVKPYDQNPYYPTPASRWYNHAGKRMAAVNVAGFIASTVLQNMLEAYAEPVKLTKKQRALAMLKAIVSLSKHVDNIKSLGRIAFKKKAAKNATQAAPATTLMSRFKAEFKKKPVFLTGLGALTCYNTYEAVTHPKTKQLGRTVKAKLGF